MRRSVEAIPNYVLRNARECQNWTQEELASRLGTTGVTISRWESGVTFPSHYYRERLSNLYGKSMRELGLTHEEIKLVSKAYPPLDASIPVSDTDIRTSRYYESIFLFNEPLPEAGEFYGRKRECERLVKRTRRNASTSIVGSRRIGKTWLITYLRHVAPYALGARFHVGYLDATMASCRTVEGFTSEALEALGLPSFSDCEGLIRLERGLKELKAANSVAVLCIDEFEGFSESQEFTLEFFRALRAMTHIFGLVLVTVSRKPLRLAVGSDIETSGFFNVFEQLTLAPFTVQEAEPFIEEKSWQAGFTQQEKAYLWKYGEEADHAWPPLRLQLTGKMLLEEQGLSKHVPEYWQTFERRLEDAYREIV